MLKSVHFAGIKSLLDVTVALEPFTVLVGPNGAGKTTVLEQMARVCEFTSGGAPTGHALGRAGEVLAAMEVDRLRTNGSLGSQIWRGIGDTGEFEVEIESGKKRWFDRTKVHLALQEGARQRWWTLIPPKGASNQEFDGEAPELGFQAIRLQLQRAAILAPSPLLRELSVPAMDGRGLPSVLAHLKLSDTPTFDAIMRDLAMVVPRFSTLRFPVVPLDKTTNGYALELVFDGVGAIPAENASEGTLFALALLTVLHARAFPTLVLIDDIDHGLHLGAQYQIIEAIRCVMAVRSDLQVVCTTHSPILLDSFKPEEVRVMALDKDGHTHVRPLTALPDFARQKRGLQTGELWASTGEDWVAEAPPDAG